MFYLEQIKMFSLFYFVTICFSFLWEIQCLFCFVFLFLFQNIQGIYFLFKKIREKITKKTFACHSEIYLSDGEALCSTEQTYARRWGKIFLLWQSLLGESQKYLFLLLCRENTRQYRRGTNSWPTPPTNFRNISAVSAEQAALWHKANVWPTPPTNISTDVFEECPTCLL